MTTDVRSNDYYRALARILLDKTYRDKLKNAFLQNDTDLVNVIIFVDGAFEISVQEVNLIKDFFDKENFLESIVGEINNATKTIKKSGVDNTVSVVGYSRVKPIDVTGIYG